MANFVKVGETGDLAPGTGKVVKKGGRSIALFNVEGTFYALENACSHWCGPLGEGKLFGDHVSCPWHGATFNVKTGDAMGLPAQGPVKAFPVKVEGNEVFVDVDIVPSTGPNV